MNNLESRRYKIGFSKGQKKLLIESVLLPEYGFNKGDHYSIDYFDNGLTLSKYKNDQSVVGRVFGYPIKGNRKARTIIEINNSTISKIFAESDYCNVIFDHNLLTIETIENK